MVATEEYQTFTSLDAWQQGHRLMLLVYRATSHFPASEKFGLVSQLRRSAISITANIAEGYGRRSYREKIQFYRIALGSIAEVRSLLMAARDIGYSGVDESNELQQLAERVQMIIIGLIRKTELFIRHS